MKKVMTLRWAVGLFCFCIIFLDHTPSIANDAVVRKAMKIFDELIRLNKGKDADLRDCIEDQIKIIQTDQKFSKWVRGFDISKTQESIKTDNNIMAFAFMGLKRREEEQRNKVKAEMPNILKVNGGELRTCYDMDKKYLSYKNGKFSGVVYKRLQLIEKNSDLKVKYNFENKFSSCLDGMKKGKYDIMTFTNKKPDRDKYMTYFHIYGKDKGIYVSKKSPFHNYPKELEKLFSHVYPAK